MKPHRRPSLPQRRRIFVGCEGESESGRGYGAFLQKLINDQDRAVHLDLVVLRPGGGDPLALTELAERRIRERTQRFGSYAAHALLLDADTIGRNRDRDARIAPIARKREIQIVWQEPCHEALLLRHLPNCGALRPLDTKRSLESLKREWPDYEKGSSAVWLGNRLEADHVRQAASVEPTLAALLKIIEFR